MLDLYVLYACVHMIAGKHDVPAGQTQCVEQQVFFSAGECRKELPKGGALIEKTRHSRSWAECRETRADSWIPADAGDPGNRLYEAHASVSDDGAIAALLAPLSPDARASLKRGFKRSRAFQGPDNLSFFIVTLGSSVVAYAVTNLDDFQFADLATDVSSASASMTTEKSLDFASMAEDAGIKLSHHMETSPRDMPPAGGMDTGP